MLDALVSLVVVSVLLLGSPGPAPLALAATGAGFGFRRGVPFLLGILSGLAVAIALGAVGVTAIFEASPSSRLAMQVLGGLYICYLAYKIATGPIGLSEHSAGTHAPRFHDGFILNVLNPKAYAIFLALFSQYLLPLSNPFKSVVATALVFFCIGIVIDIIWLAMGELLRPAFEAPKKGRLLRIAFGLAMVATIIITFASR